MLLIPPKFKFIGGFIMQKISEQVIFLFFNKCLKKQTICKRLQISIYELDRILDAYYNERAKSNFFCLTWCKTHLNSYTIPKKQSFIDFIVQKESKKENNNFDGGVVA
jgi:hypothetical protein